MALETANHKPSLWFQNVHHTSVGWPCGPESYRKFCNYINNTIRFTTVLSQRTAPQLHTDHFQPAINMLSDKNQGIITKDVAPISAKEVLNDLKESRFISVIIDPSNHFNLKLVPLLIR
jgi:hypothetical protein